MDPSVLKHKITVQTTTSTPDGMGGMVETATVFAVVRAGLWPVSAREVVQNSQLQGQITHRVRIRYLSGITSAMKILFGSRTFTIQSVINPNEAAELLDLLCLEIT